LASLASIAPLTVRNAVAFHEFIPLSLGAGTTFVEGLGDLDVDGNLGLPKTDEDVMRLDEHLRDQAAGSYTALYSPNGVSRDRERFRFGRGVVSERPAWYLAGVAKRGLSTLRLERVPAIDPARDERETTNGILYLINRPLKLIQRVFITAIFLPLALVGLIVGFWRRRYETLALLVLPIYYATVQPLVHTEYRYVLITPHIMMIFSAFALVFVFERMMGIIGRRDIADLPRTE